MSRATIAWKVNAGTPTSLQSAAIARERDLEDWIEKTPALIGAGLVILARQLETESGPLDLLALDKLGALVVIELKRAKAYRDTAGQVLDYAAWVAQQDYEALRLAIDANRVDRGYEGTLETVLRSHLGEAKAAQWAPDDPGVRFVVAGTGGDDSLRRIITYLSETFNVPINGVFFDFYEGSFLVRTSVLTDEEEVAAAGRKGRGGMTDARLREFAKLHQTDEIVAPILAKWEPFTTQAPRPERNNYWTLGASQNGTRTVARLSPWSQDGRDGVAWLLLKIGALAEDVQRDEASVTKEWTDAGLSPDADGWVELPSVDAAQKAVDIFRKLYAYDEPKAAAAKATNGIQGAVPE